MKRGDIVRMANQIADFHKPFPEDEAVEGVARHIIDFWDPRMRADLAAELARDESGFNELALKGARVVVDGAAAHAS